MVHRWLACLLGIVVSSSMAGAANTTWIGGNVDWVDGAANNANWNLNDEPDSNDIAIFNTANAVNLGSNNAVQGLTMSAGIDLNVNGFQLDVNGLTQLSGAGTNLVIGGATGQLTSNDVIVTTSANLELNGGSIVVLDEGADGVLTTGGGGVLVGHGAVNMNDGVGAATTLFDNQGAITARRTPLIIFGTPPVGSLSLNALDSDARIDLDGVTEAGVVNVTRNQTLDLNIRLSDTFNGTVNLAHNATLDLSTSWSLGAGGAINANNGFVDGVFPTPDAPADTSIIAGGALVQNGGTINVVDTDGTLQFDAVFTMNGGTFINQGHTIFNNDATINAAATFTMGLSSSDLTVGANADVLIEQVSFNLDGNSVGTIITVNQGGVLTLDLGDYDNDVPTNSFDATVNLTSSTISVNVTDLEFIMDGVLNSNASGSDQSLWTGNPLAIGNDAGPLDADVNISGSQPTQFGSAVRFNSDADVNVADGATMHFLSVVNFNSVNGGNNAEFTGGGEIVFSAAVNFTEATTLNLLGGIVDLDGADSIGDTINVDAPLVINAELMRSFGKNNGGGGTNFIDVNNSVGTGVLTVNLDNAADEWTLHGPGVMNLVNDNTEATLLAGSDVNIDGAVNVTGDVRTTARLDIAGTVNINTAGQPLRFAGGDNLSVPNTIVGGTINGPGLLGADTGFALHGFGTINAGIDFDGASNLFADDGTLTINGAIVDVARIGTADADGVLNVVNPWDTSVASFVTLEGGILQGGTMTINNGNGVSGSGSITSRLVNNVRLRASGSPLVVETAGDDNDWDGAAGNGVLAAVNSGTLELRDVGAAFGFLGTAEASLGGRIFTNGFALDFNPGSSLNLDQGSYESTNSTDLGGTVTVGVGGGTIEVEINNFLTFEPTSVTTLSSNLTLLNNNIIIEDGATFSGVGALVFPDGSNLVAENGADVGVLLDMQGGFRPGNSEGIARVDLFDFQQSSTSKLFVELTGTALNAFDRLVASGDVIVDGFLSIDIDEVSPGVPFVPALGQTFNIITANSVTGEFDFADVAGMPAGLAFHIEYLSNAVQLQVVSEPLFSADFDEDGDVDPTDLQIWRGAYDLNQLGDADGDNDSDGNDFLTWQRQVGSAPAVVTTAAVPEPAAITLTLTFSTILMGAQRGRRP